MKEWICNLLPPFHASTNRREGRFHRWGSFEPPNSGCKVNGGGGGSGHLKRGSCPFQLAMERFRVKKLSEIETGLSVRKQIRI